MITIQQELRASDFRQALFVHLRPRPGLKAAGILVLILVAITFAWELAHPTRWNVYTLILVGVLAYLAWLFFVFLPSCATRSYNQNKFLKHATTLRIDESGIHAESDLGNSTVPWDHLHKWKEGRNLILLYPMDSMYFVFPRRVFPGASWEEFRQLAAARVRKIN